MTAIEIVIVVIAFMVMALAAFVAGFYVAMSINVRCRGAERSEP